VKKNSDFHIDENILFTGKTAKTISIDLINSVDFEDSIVKNFYLSENLTDELDISESFKYTKSEKFLRKIILLTKRDKSILLVKSD